MVICIKLFLTCIRILNLVYFLTEINLNIFHVKQARGKFITFLFSLWKDFFIHENVPGLNSISDELDSMLDIFMKLFIILYADNTVLMAESATIFKHYLINFIYIATFGKRKSMLKRQKQWYFLKDDYQEIFILIIMGLILRQLKISIIWEFIFLRRESKFIKKHLSEKAIKAMYEVVNKGRTHNLSMSYQFDLFDKLVKPILLYGCEIWGFGNNDILEKVHLKFCKIILHLKITTPNCMIY